MSDLHYLKVSQFASLTAGSNFFTFIFLELSRFITGSGTGTALVGSLAHYYLIGALYIVRNRPREYAQELRENNE